MVDSTQGQIEKKPVAYLAGPLTAIDELVVDRRIILFNKVAYHYLRRGQLVYCPVHHNHLYNAMGHAGDWQHWQAQNDQLLIRCDALHLLEMEGWQASKGLAREIWVAEQHQIPIIHVTPSQLATIEASTPEPSHFDRDLQYFQRLVMEMIVERGWHRKNCPKNIVMSLQVEAAELAEHFTWLSESESEQLEPETRAAVEEEVADVFINLLDLCQHLQIPLLSVVDRKIQQIKARYPVASATT